MIDQLKWLGKKEELAFEKHTFRGKLAGKAWKYSKNIDGLIRTRAIIFLMALVVFYPLIGLYAVHGEVFTGLLAERLVYALLLILAGLLFNKFRILSIFLAALPLIAISLSYILIPGVFDSRKLGFTIAMLLFVFSGLYHHFQLKKLRRELETGLLENQLLE